MQELAFHYLLELIGLAIICRALISFAWMLLIPNNMFGLMTNVVLGWIVIHLSPKKLLRDIIPQNMYWNLFEASSVELVKQADSFWKLYGVLKNLVTTVVNKCFHISRSDYIPIKNHLPPHWRAPDNENSSAPAYTTATEDITCLLHKEAKEQISKFASSYSQQIIPHIYDFACDKLWFYAKGGLESSKSLTLKAIESIMLVGGSLAMCSQLLPYQAEQTISKAMLQMCSTVIGVTFLPQSILTLGMLGWRLYDSYTVVGLPSCKMSSQSSSAILSIPDSVSATKTAMVEAPANESSIIHQSKSKPYHNVKNNTSYMVLQFSMISRRGQEKYFNQLTELFRRNNCKKEYLQLVFITLYLTNILAYRLQSASYQYKWYRYLLLCHILKQQQ